MVSATRAVGTRAAVASAARVIAAENRRRE